MKKIISLTVICIVLMVGSTYFTKGQAKEITIYTSQESEDIDYLIGDFNEKYPDIKVT